MPTTLLYRLTALSRGPEILAYIHKHYRDNITLEELRNEINVNEKACRSLIKEVTGGKSLREYHEQFRLDQAFKDVSDFEQIHITIEGIAKSHGYCTASYFIRVFKKHYGLTPQEYRERNITLLPNQ